jgi:DNA-binding NarL/FixJ family response regulator
MKAKSAITDDNPFMIDGIKTVLSDTPEIEIVR